jgi:hypothetical protein
LRRGGYPLDGFAFPMLRTLLELRGLHEITHTKLTTSQLLLLGIHDLPIALLLGFKKRLLARPVLLSALTLPYRMPDALGLLLHSVTPQLFQRFQRIATFHS